MPSVCLTYALDWQEGPKATGDHSEDWLGVDQADSRYVKGTG